MNLNQLQANVLRQLSGIRYHAGDLPPPIEDDLFSTLEAITNHGSRYGFSGFIYTRDCVRFALDNWAGIMALARETLDAIGEPETVAQLVAQFQCVDVPSNSVEAVLIQPHYEDDDRDTVLNALAGFALEETARAIVDNAR